MRSGTPGHATDAAQLHHRRTRLGEPLVVHCLPPHLLFYFARDWARLLNCPPVGPSRSSTHDAASARVGPLIAEASALRDRYHPWAQAKRKLRARLAFWRR